MSPCLVLLRPHRLPGDHVQRPPAPHLYMRHPAHLTCSSIPVCIKLSNVNISVFPVCSHTSETIESGDLFLLFCLWCSLCCRDTEHIPTVRLVKDNLLPFLNKKTQHVAVGTKQCPIRKCDVLYILQ